MIHRFYLDHPLDISLSLSLPKDICSHIHILRLTQRNSVQFFNGDGYHYSANLLFKDRHNIIAQITNKTLADNESSLKISLIQSFSSSQKMDFIIQKAVELGVHEIYPAISERTNTKFSITKIEEKQKRWTKIIISACEQSGRSVIPRLYPMKDFTVILQSITAEHKLILHPFSKNDNLIKNIPYNASLAIAIGPEGGFSEQEINLAQIYRFIGYSLGPRILRTETAPIAALSSLQAKYGDLL